MDGEEEEGEGRVVHFFGGCGVVRSGWVWWEGWGMRRELTKAVRGAWVIVLCLGTEGDVS